MNTRSILFLTRTAQIGGAEKRLIDDYFRALTQRGYTVTWAVTSNVFENILPQGNGRLNVVRLPDFHKESNDIKALVMYYKYIRSLHADRIVFSQFWMTSFSLPMVLAGVLATAKRCTLLVHDNAVMPPRYRSGRHLGIIPGIGIEWWKEYIYRLLMARLANKIIAVSPCVKNTLIKSYYYRKDKIEVVLKTIDTVRFAPSPDARRALRETLNIPLDDPVIISASRIGPEKRIDRLVEAFGRLEGASRAWLCILGTGKLAGQVEARVRELDGAVRCRVKILGHRDNVVPYLQGSDIFVLPSDSEGFSNACAEAMATGLVVVATRCGGPESYIRDGVNGFLVEKSVEGLREGLAKALGLPPEARTAMQAQARQSIHESFADPGATDRIAGFFQ